MLPALVNRRGAAAPRRRPRAGQSDCDDQLKGCRPQPAAGSPVAFVTRGLRDFVVVGCDSYFRSRFFVIRVPSLRNASKYMSMRRLASAKSWLFRFRLSRSTYQGAFAGSET